MLYANMLKRFITVLLLMIASLALPENAFAARAAGSYVTSCASCHDPLATSTKKNKSAAVIKAAIATPTNGMGSLSSLTDAQLDDIAVQLGSPSTCLSPKIWDATGKICAAPIVSTLPTTTIPSPVGLVGSGLAKTDVYNVTCPVGASYLSVSVKDALPAKLPLVSIQAISKNLNPTASAQSIDGTTGTAGTVGDGDTLYSLPTPPLLSTSRVFAVTVSKSAYTGLLAAHKGEEFYQARFDCKTAAVAGITKAATYTLTQNQ